MGDAVRCSVSQLVEGELDITCRNPRLEAMTALGKKAIREDAFTQPFVKRAPTDTEHLGNFGKVIALFVQALAPLGLVARRPGTFDFSSVLFQEELNLFLRESEVLKRAQIDLFSACCCPSSPLESKFQTGGPEELLSLRSGRQLELLRRSLDRTASGTTATTTTTAAAALAPTSRARREQLGGDDVHLPVEPVAFGDGLHTFHAGDGQVDRAPVIGRHRVNGDDLVQLDGFFCKSLSELRQFRIHILRNVLWFR